MNPIDDDLLDRALEGGLSEEEERRLVDRLKNEPDLARRMMERSRDDALFAEWAEERRALGRERPSSSSRWALRPLVAAAALLIAAILIFLLWPAPRGRNAFEIVAKEGSVDASAGAIRCGAGSRATLRYADGTTLEIREKTEITPDRQEVRLSAGSVAAHVAKLPPGETFAIETPQAEARVLGTRFELTVDAGSTRLQVDEGRVLFTPRAGGFPVTVAGGSFAVARPGREVEVALFRGTGLKSEYFGDDTLTNLKLTRIDPTVDFNWGWGSPDVSVSPEHFSVRWTGQIEAAATGAITFTTISDDGVRLWIDGTLVIDDWTVRGTLERNGRIDLVAGRRYTLKLEYFQCVATANVKLLWARPGGPREVIPRERLFPAP